MIAKFRNYNFNYLVITGAVIFCCTLLLYTIISLFFIQELSESSRLNSINNYYFFVISALLIAPIIEEFIFRGYFLNKFLFKMTSILGIIFYINVSGNLYLYFLICLIVILHFIKKFNPIYIYFLNSLTFTLVHYKLSDFNSIFTIIPMFFQFSLGLILIWIVLNFNLIKSILFHFLYNFICVVIFTIPLQFPEKRIRRIEQLGYKFEWNKTPIFNSKNIIISRPNEYEITAKNIDIQNLYNAFETNSKKIKVSNENKFYRFKFKIIKIDSTANKLDSKTMVLLLKKADLIEN